MSQHPTHPVEVLTEALRQSLRVGARPAGLVAYLHLFPDEFCADDDTYRRASRIVAVISEAVYSLSNGPYGRAAQALFGLTAETRGMMLKYRRKAAADELDVAVGTWRRWYERSLVKEVAVFANVMQSTTDPSGER